MRELRRRLLLDDLPLELAHLRREVGVLGLEQEGVEPAAMVDGLERIGRDPHAHRRPSASEISVTFCKFGRNRRLVLMLEWLTLWPTRAFLPVRSQRQDMAHPSKITGASAPVTVIVMEDGRTYRERGKERQAEQLSADLTAFRGGPAELRRRANTDST